MMEIWKLLYEHKTSLVITGHDHYFEQSHPMNAKLEDVADGLTQLIVGTGGAFPAVRTNTRKETDTYKNHQTCTFGVLVLELFPADAARGKLKPYGTWRFRGVPYNGFEKADDHPSIFTGEFVGR
jgi:hypothetical protein